MTRREIYQMRRGLALEVPSAPAAQPVALKHLLAHHSTLEQHHRSLCTKLTKSPLRAGRELAVKHKRAWHHHAKIRTQLEERERNGETSAPAPAAMSDMVGLTRRERYELRTRGMGLFGRIAGGAAGAATAGNLGAAIGSAGGPVGTLAGGAAGLIYGAYKGGQLGHAAEEHVMGRGDKLNTAAKKKDLERRWAHITGSELADNASQASSLKSKKAPKKGADGKYDTKQLADHFYKKSQQHKARGEEDDAGEAAEVADYFQKHHENGVSRHGAWDESKHPRDGEGQFT
jgi:hypothetical protein